MPYELREFEYNRKKAVAYAHYWAYRRNEEYYSFNELGGDCTNFVSQCIYAGAGIMNYTPTYGWYYIDLNNRAPAWTGVNELYQFLTNNKEEGPFGIDTEVSKIETGDVIQFKLDTPQFSHTVIVISTGQTPSSENIFVASHSNDADCRPMSTYSYTDVRYIHIQGVRYVYNTSETNVQDFISKE